MQILYICDHCEEASEFPADFSRPSEPLWREQVRVQPNGRLVCKSCWIDAQPGPEPDDGARWADLPMPVNAATAPALLEALRLSLSALHEAEAILGGEYGDHYGVLCEQMSRLREEARAALAAAEGEQS